MNVLLIRRFHFAFTNFEDVPKINNHIVNRMAEVYLYVTCVELDTKLGVGRFRFVGILFYFKDAINIEFFYNGKVLL